MYGVEFPRMETIDVEEKKVAYTVKRLNPKTVITAFVVDKLKGNNQFEQVKAKPGPKPKVKNDNASGNTQPGTEQA